MTIERASRIVGCMKAVVAGWAIFAVLVSAGSCSDSGDTTGGNGGSGSGGGGQAASSPASSSATGAGGAGGAGGETPCSGMMLSGPCDPVAQDCPMGERCVVDPLGAPATSCIPMSDGDNPSGSYCGGHDDCAPGTACIGGACNSYCCVGDDSPCSGWFCEFVLEVGEQSIGLCSFEERCALFDNDSCAPGHICVLQQQNPNQCVMPGSGLGDGEACQFIGDCDAGLYCNNNTCRYWCDTAASGVAVTEGGCPSGQSCQPVDVPEHPGVGLCAP